MRMWVRSLVLLSRLSIQHRCEVWYRLQTRLGSCVAAAVTQCRNYSSNLTPSQRTSICHMCGPKKQASKETKKKQRNVTIKIFVGLPTVAQWVKNLTVAAQVTVEVRVQTPAWHSGLKDPA